jgi:hypothetical protein
MKNISQGKPEIGMRNFRLQENCPVKIFLSGFCVKEQFSRYEQNLSYL